MIKIQLIQLAQQILPRPKRILPLIFTLCLCQLSAQLSYINLETGLVAKSPDTSYTNTLARREKGIHRIKSNETSFLKLAKALGWTAFVKNQNSAESKEIALFFMLRNAAYITQYQDTQQERELTENDGFIFHVGEYFFVGNIVKLPRQVCFFDLGLVTYYKKHPLPAGWEWDQSGAFATPASCKKALEQYCTRDVLIDNFGIAKYRLQNGSVFYRAVVHRRPTTK